MSRLIREEDLLYCLDFENTEEEREENVGEIITLEMIDRIPTAIDLDRVIIRLHREKDEMNKIDQCQIAKGIGRAISIIKGYEENPMQWSASKEKPCRPIYESDGYAPDGMFVYNTWICPNCETRYEVDYDDYDYCPNCGQRIDWSDEE